MIRWTILFTLFFLTFCDAQKQISNMTKTEFITPFEKNKNTTATYQEAIAYYEKLAGACLLYTSPSPRDQRGSRMPSSA